MDKHFSFKNIVCSTGEIALDYEAYLQTNHWRTLRKQIYDDRNQKCQKCKKVISDYHVHHVTYERIGKERKSDLKLFCYKCHEKVHLKKDKNRTKASSKKRLTIATILSEKPKEHFYAGKYYNASEAKKVYPVQVIKMQ